LKGKPLPTETAKVIPYRPRVFIDDVPRPREFTHNLIHTIGRGMVFGGRRNAPSAAVFQLEARQMARKHGISVEEMIGESRKQKFVRARQELCHTLSKKHGWSLPSIGSRLNNRDHTTILHAIRRHQKILDGGKI
jgi:chromosomal replication initiation ATPase DnaA